MITTEENGSSDSSASQGQVTALLRRARSDRRTALDELIPIVYGTLRQLAHRALLQERPGHTLNSTALAHEAYARLVGLEQIEWRDRAHFFAAAAGAMRRVLIDYALARRAAKRGGGAAAVDLSQALLITDAHLDDALAVHEALLRLEAAYPGTSRLVECRVFAGMTVEETAAALELSPATVKRHWAAARAWLARELSAGLT